MDTVVFHFDSGPLLDCLLRQPVSFEADGSDPFHRRGWVVQIDGMALEIDEDPDHQPPLEPWSATEDQVAIRLTPATVVGRSFEIVRPAGFR